MRSTKGIEVQFHWVFILIAGALILTFFVTFAQRQKAVGEERIAIRLGGIFDTILVNALQSPGTSQSLPAPSGGMTFTCSATCACTFTPGDVAFMTLDKPLFAPGRLEQADIALWTLPWSVPFRVANFIFLTNRLIKYYIVHEPADRASLALALAINKSIPQKSQGRTLIDAELVTLADIPSLTDTGVPESRFILAGLDEPLGLDPSFRKSKVTAVALTGTLNEGTAAYYVTDEDGSLYVEESGLPYLGRAGLFAAIFADTPQMYKCGIYQALRRLDYTSQVYARRTESLQGTGPRQQCSYFAGPVLAELSTIGRQGHDTSDLMKLTQIPPLMQRLEQENQAARDGSCTTIY
jgi:hypothetical protein